jgi:hypothetical protein
MTSTSYWPLVPIGLSAALGCGGQPDSPSGSEDPASVDVAASSATHEGIGVSRWTAKESEVVGYDDADRETVSFRYKGETISPNLMHNSVILKEGSRVSSYHYTVETRSDGAERETNLTSKEPDHAASLRTLNFLWVDLQAAMASGPGNGPSPASLRLDDLVHPVPLTYSCESKVQMADGSVRTLISTFDPLTGTWHETQKPC